MDNQESGVKPLKEWRISKYLSLRTLARNAGISVDALRRAESSDPVREITQRKIADTLGVKVNQIAEFSQE